MRKLAATLAAATIFFAPNANAAGIGDSAGQPLEVDSSWVTQNAIWWFGQPNPNPPEQTVVWAFQPLNAILWAKPLFPQLWAWFETVQSETCFIGITTRINGPYAKPGEITHSYSRQGCA